MKQALGRLFPRLRDFRRLRRSYRVKFGHSPRFVFAKTFNEKLWHRKLLDRDLRMPLRSDKLLVKNFVAEKLGPGWITPTLWHGASLPPLHERIWPRPFVLKTNHGSGMNIFVRSANDLDWPQIEVLCAKWLSENYGESTGQWFYSNIERQLLIEPFIRSTIQAFLAQWNAPRTPFMSKALTEEAANWAHRVLGAKNSLTAVDAACIEEAFRAKLAMFATGA
jgi:TupA-like ATPgrasp